MKGFLILVFLSYASSDKLDLTYLPPPGSQYAGGRPEDIQTPLEFPKETYHTTARQQLILGSEPTNPDDYKLIGTDSRLPSPNPNNFVPQGQKETFNNYPSSYKVPTTTTSYAFTQTTTYPPSESYDTTISPINPITGRPYSNNFNVLSQEPGQAYQDSVSPIRPNTFGDQLTVNQFGGSQPTLTSPGSAAPFPGSLIPSQAPNGQTYIEQNNSGQPQYQQNFQQSNSARIPGLASHLPFTQSQSPSLANGYLNQPGFSSSTELPQGIVSGPLSEATYGDNVINSHKLAGAMPDAFHNNVLNQRPNVFRPDTKVVDTQNQYPTAVQGPQQQYPGYSGSDFKRVQGVVGNNLPSPINQENVASAIYNNRLERPQAEADRNAVILNYTNVITPEGFAYSFDTSNGIHADESGTATDGVKAEGSYSYTGDDGKVYTVVYTADENGFQPHGDHLPTPPPIPEAIQRVIEKVRKEEEAGIFHDGHYDDNKYGDTMYRRPVSRYPQGSNKFIKNGADVPNEVDYDFSQENPRKPSKFQSGLERPNGSESATNNDYLGESQKGQNEDKLRKPASVSSNLGQNNRISGQSSLTMDDYDEADFRKKQPFVKVSSERPTTDKEENQYTPDTLKENNIKEQVNTRKSSGNKATNLYPIQQDTFKQTDVKDDRFANNDSIRRPNIQQKIEQSENDQTPASINNNNKQRNYNREKEIIGRPLDGVKNENVEINFGIHQDRLKHPINKFPIEHSTHHSIIDEDEFERPNPYDRNENISKDKEGNIHKYNNLPTKYLEDDEEKTEYTDDYGVTSETPSYRPRPEGVSRPVIKMLYKEKILSTKRRPARPGIRVDENVTEEYGGSIDDISEAYDVHDEDDNKADSYTTPRYQATNNEYKVSQKIKSPNVQKISNRASTKYSQPHNVLQGTSQVTHHDKSVDEQFTDNINPQFGQKLTNRPTNIPSNGLVENKQRFEQLSNNTGYMYIPPRNRFNYYEENNKAKAQATSSAPFSTTKKPSYQTTNYQNKDGTVKPFMTLNVKRVDNKNPEEENEEEITPGNEELPYKQRYEDLDRVVNVQYTTPDKIFSDEVISTTKPLMQSFVSPTFQTSRIPQYNNKQYYNENSSARPLQPSQETYIQKGSSNKTSFGRVPSTTPLTLPKRPTYYNTTPQGTITPGLQETYNTEGNYVQKLPNNNVPYSTSTLPTEGQYNEQYYNENPSTGPLQSSQETYIRKDSSNRTPFNKVPSTTPLPSSKRPTYYNTTPQGIIIPGQNNVYNTEGNTVQRIPNNNTAYSTTPLPSEGQYNEQYYNENPSPGPLQPSQETFIGKDSKNKTPFGRVPSTTSLPSPRRPTYYDTTPHEVIIPGQQTVHNTNGNFDQRLHNNNVDYPTTPLPSAGQSSDRFYPDGKGQHQTTYSYRPTNPPIGYTDGTLASRLPTPGPSFGPTAGPAVVPINVPQVVSNGITESVKYGSRLPTTTYRPNYTIGSDDTSFPKPGIQVDSLGRPIVRLDQPDFNQQFVTGTEENIPVGNLNSRYNMRQNISGINKSGLDKDVQNYQTSTERIVGEDFSGPKQQQRFDPKLGYYY